MYDTASLAAPQGGRCFIRRLALTDYRNHARFTAEISARAVALSGPNGAGKTNVLEALSLFAPGKGLRGAASSEFFRVLSAEEREAGAPAPGAWAAAALADGLRGLTERIGTGAKESKIAKKEGEGAEGRAVSLNGKRAAQTELPEILRVLWTSPALQHKLAESPGERRRWLDRLAAALFPAHERAVRAYEHYVRERMRVLTLPRGFDAMWAETLEAEIAVRGMAVCRGRLRAAELVNRATRERGGPFPAADVIPEGEPEALMQGGMDDAELDGRWRERLGAARAQDGISKRTAFGVHRSDVRLRYAGKEMDYLLCSSGQQKALLLSVFLAHGALTARHAGGAPVMLADEAFAQLDEERRRYFYEALLETSGQCWLTGTDADDFGMLGPEALALRL